MTPQENKTKALNSQPEVLVAQEIRKTYGSRPALHGLSFSLRAGRILGFLGPNGAGKTTAIRILTTILEPDSGYFFIEGIGSEHPDKIRRRIGVLPESLGFPKQINAIDFLTYFGQLYGQNASEARTNALARLEDVGLQQRGNSQIGSYSRGMRQRLGIARALINNPAVVFLDEPTLGLDPRGQQELLKMIRRIAHERNAGVVLCSHLLSEIEGICDDVVILNLGQVVAKGSVTEVIGKTQQEAVHQNVLRVRVPSASLGKAKKILMKAPNVQDVALLGELDGWLQIELANPAKGNTSKAQLANNMILMEMINAKIPILTFEARGNRLQDVFLQLTEETIE